MWEEQDIPSRCISRGPERRTAVLHREATSMLCSRSWRQSRDAGSGSAACRVKQFPGGQSRYRDLRHVRLLPSMRFLCWDLVGSKLKEKRACLIRVRPCDGMSLPRMSLLLFHFRLALGCSILVVIQICVVLLCHARAADPYASNEDHRGEHRLSRVWCSKPWCRGVAVKTSPEGRVSGKDSREQAWHG